MKKIKEEYLGSTIRDHHGNWVDINYDNIGKLSQFSNIFVGKDENKPKLKKTTDAKSNKRTAKHNSSNSTGEGDADKS